MKVMVMGDENKEAVIKKITKMAEENVINENEIEIEIVAGGDIERFVIDSNKAAELAAYMSFANAGISDWMHNRNTDFDPKRFSIGPTHDKEYITARREKKKHKTHQSSAKKNKKKRGF